MAYKYRTIELNSGDYAVGFGSGRKTRYLTASVNSNKAEVDKNVALENARHYYHLAREIFDNVADVDGRVEGYDFLDNMC